MWALGCVLYELMTLTPPFIGSTIAELFHSIEHKTPKSVSAPYSRHLSSLCMKLLAKSRDERPFIDDILQEFPEGYKVRFCLTCR